MNGGVRPARDRVRAASKTVCRKAISAPTAVARVCFLALPKKGFAGDRCFEGSQTLWECSGSAVLAGYVYFRNRMGLTMAYFSRVRPRRRPRSVSAQAHIVSLRLSEMVGRLTPPLMKASQSFSWRTCARLARDPRSKVETHLR